MSRLLRVITSVAVLAALLSTGGVGTGRAALESTRWAGAGRPALPRNVPEEGLVYDGLTPADPAGPCARAGFELRMPGGDVLCSHGPDPFQAGGRLAVGDAAFTKAAMDIATSGVVPCVTDGASGRRVQAIYAVASDKPNRFAEVAAMIRRWAAGVNEVFERSARQTGGHRSLRWVTNGCELSVLNVTVPPSGDDNLWNTMVELGYQGHNNVDRKYLVWMDANVYCGIGDFRPDDNPGRDNANNGGQFSGLVARIDKRCWGSTAMGLAAEVHELVHTLGGVQFGAPNAGDLSHCTDDNDVMCYGPGTRDDVCPDIEEVLLDCNDDDYFSTRPVAGSWLAGHWNVANSDFLTAAWPLNDAMLRPPFLEGSAGTVGGSTAGATRTPDEPRHAGQPGGSSVWFAWKAPRSGPVKVSLTAGFDTLLAAYTGDTSSTLQVKAFNDDAYPATRPGSTTTTTTCTSCANVTLPTSAMTFEATRGTTYRIAVDGKNGASGTFRISWQQRPSNDEFAAATVITGRTGRAAGTSVMSTREAGEPSLSQTGNHPSVWYRWRAPASADATVSTFGSPGDSVVAVFTGSVVGSLTAVTALRIGDHETLNSPPASPPGVADNSPTMGTDSWVQFRAVKDTTYHVRVEQRDLANSGPHNVFVNLYDAKVSIGDAVATERDGSEVAEMAFPVSLGGGAPYVVSVSWERRLEDPIGSRPASMSDVVIAESGRMDVGAFEQLALASGSTRSTVPLRAVVLPDDRVEGTERFQVLIVRALVTPPSPESMVRWFAPDVVSRRTAIGMIADDD